MSDKSDICVKEEKISKKFPRQIVIAAYKKRCSTDNSYREKY